MDYYIRNIKFYKSFQLVDSDGDGVKDTMSYRPTTNNYHLQIGINQNVKDIGNYFLGENQDFEVIDSSTIWDESNDGINNDDPYTPPSLDDPFAEDEGSLTGFDPTQFCNDPNASNYNPSLVGVPGFDPCPGNSCCEYLELGDWTQTGDDSLTNNLDCLAIYTDWGPWNDNLLLNDTEQLYLNVPSENCTLTFRFINQLSAVGPTDGGWYGASIKIEIDEGNGFQEVTPSSTYIQNTETDISFTNNQGYTLGDKVRIWKAKKVVLNTTEYYTTKPFRDLTITPPPNVTLKVTYRNPTSFNNTTYLTFAKYTRLQIIKGNTTNPTPTPPTPSSVGGLNWDSPSQQTLDLILGTPTNRASNGETFHYLSDNLSTSNTLKDQVWARYLNGYIDSNLTVPWGPATTNIEVGNFYNNGVIVTNDFGNDVNNTILQYSDNTSLDWIQNPSEELVTINNLCNISVNYVSYFDKNGDGFIEYDVNYPNINTQSPGSVDSGLFSKTRYDSPYIYLTPGTTDGTTPLTNNQLTENPLGTSSDVIGLASSAGWKSYYYGNGSSNVSPTCQLGGCDNVYNSLPQLTDPSNSNIFLPQSDPSNTSGCANYGTNQEQVFHLWNYGTKDAMGGCCAKPFDPSLDISNDGPYFDSKCSRCHLQMTTRSAQPVFDNNVRTQMQTSSSSIYYGPFYDSANPTYNGYGLAFSKANNFCRNVKSRNGVQIINSEEGTNENNLFIGGILHGGGIQVSPNTNLNQNLGVQVQKDNFDSSGTQTNCFFQTLPLKCERVTNDPNCPSNNCMKCIYCFKCSSDTIQGGTFTGNNSDPSGPSGGVTEVGDYVLLDSFGQEISQIEINNAPCVDPLNIEPTEIRDFTLEVIDTPVNINLFLDGGPGGGPDCPQSASISQDLAYVVTINDGMGGPINNTIFTGTIALSDTDTLTEIINNTGTYQGQIKIFPYYRNDGFTVKLTAS